MTAQTSRTTQHHKRMLKQKQTNSVLNDTVLNIQDNSKGPVVNLGLKEVLNEVFGFIRVGGDFN